MKLRSGWMILGSGSVGAWTALGALTLAGCNKTPEAGSLVQGAGVPPPFLSQRKLESCKEEEAALDARGIPSQTSLNLTGGEEDPELEPQSHGDPKGRAPSRPVNVPLPKSKAYLMAVFNHLVAADAKQKQPFFTGVFNRKNFCISVEEDPRVNAYALSTNGSVVFTTGMLLSSHPTRIWSVMSHELSHVLLGHSNTVFPGTTYRLPTAAEEARAAQLRNDFVAADALARRALFQLEDLTVMTGAAQSFRERVSENQKRGVSWEKILATLLMEVSPSTPAEHAELNVLTLASIILSSPKAKCDDGCKAAGLESADLYLRNMTASVNAYNELVQLLSIYYSPEMLANGRESHADSLGQLILERAGFHPAVTPFSWLFSMIVNSPEGSELWNRISKLPQQQQTLEILNTKTIAADCLAAVILEDEGAKARQLYQGLQSHPPFCYRYAQSRQQAIDAGKNILAPFDESMLPQVQPNLEEAKLEIRNAYIQAGRPVPQFP